MSDARPAPFLKSIARDFYHKKSHELYRYRFHFQNKRAGRFFIHYLKEQAKIEKNTVILPEVTTLHDFLRRRTHLPEVDVNNKLFVLHELFLAYQEVFPSTKERTFDDFFRVGELILADFNDLDKQLVDVEKIMQNAQDADELLVDPSEYLNENQQKALNRFAKVFTKDAESTIRGTFKDFWAKMPLLYQTTKERLRKRGLSYEGMIYRGIKERLDSDESFSLTDDGIINVFIGLNTLTKAETAILTHFKTSHPETLFYWDYDSPLLQETEIAGHFRKQNLERFPDARGTDRPQSNYLPEVKVYATPSSVAQARLIGQILGKASKESLDKAIDNLRIAIVLPNERLLLPILSSIPDDVKMVNVTMGYPARETPMMGMLLRLLQLLTNFKSRKSTWRGEEVREIINMSVLDPILNTDGASLRESLNKIIINGKGKYFFLNTEELQSLVDGIKSNEEEKELAKILFFSHIAGSPTKDTGEELLSYFLDLLTILRNSDVDKKSLTYSVICTIHDILLQQSNNIESYRTDNNADEIFTFRIMSDLLRTYFTNCRIPYEGEPIKGLQVMGLLETRGLDFDYVFIPDASEGSLPAKTTSLGVLPHLLRKGYGMPTYDWQNITRSYNFFRLICRAKKVIATYDSRKGDMSVGEPSRYLRLLQYIYDKGERNRVKFTSANYPILPLKTLSESEKLLNKEKISEYQEMLKAKPGSKDSIHLSPSSISIYINCPRSFYYRYIAGLKEPEEMEEIMDAAERGTLTHHVLYELYKRFVGKQVDPSILFTWLQPTDNTIQNLIDAYQQIQYGKEGSRGINKIFEAEAKRGIQRVIRADYDAITQNPRQRLEIIGLEYNISAHHKLSESGEGINIRGKVDRLDKLNDQVRIIDYKTGRDTFDFDLSKIVIGNKDVSNVATQLLTYCMIYKEAPEGLGSDPCPQMYQLRLKDTVQQFREKNTGYIEKYSNVKQFENQLNGILREIIDTENKFEPTQNNCTYCPAVNVCKAAKTPK